MNRLRPLLTLLAFSSLVSQLCTSVHAQGSLAPPAGPPVPVMKTLDQVEARIPVTAETCPGNATAVYVIGQPGSYYLTGNLAGQSGKSGIVLNAAGITLDLNGFSLTAAVGATKGIVVSSAGGPVAIRNGIIRLWPQQGIQFTAASEFTIEDVTVYNVSGRGIDALGAGTFERVSVRGAKDYGIYCDGAPQVAVRDCKVENITGSGITMGIFAANGLVSRCSVAGVTGGSGGGSVSGINAPDGLVEACSVRGILRNGSTSRVTGIEGADTVTDCSITGITGNGPAGGSSPQEAAGIFSCTNVSRCTVSTVNGGAGQDAVGIGGSFSVSQCSVAGISGNLKQTGISGGQITDSNVIGVPAGHGMDARNAARCTIQNSAWGIYLINDTLPGGGESSSATGNTILNCTNFGIVIGTRQAVVTGNNVNGSLSVAGSTGISGTIAFPMRIEGNHVTRWATGIEAASANALVVRNTAGTNTTDFVINAAMPVVTIAALGTNPNANVRQ